MRQACPAIAQWPWQKNRNGACAACYRSRPALPASIEQAGKTYITRNALEAPIRFLASDELEGRGPASRGDQLARLYLATQAGQAAQRPRRSILFLFVAGEERGLLGSSYYALHPTFPAGRIAANINFDDGTDFIGRPADWGRKQIEEWEQKQYHQPSDRLDGSWSFDGMIEDAQLGFYSGWIIAQADAMPTWNPGDEFEAARKRALAAIR